MKLGPAWGSLAYSSAQNEHIPGIFIDRNEQTRKAPRLQPDTFPVESERETRWGRLRHVVTTWVAGRYALAMTTSARPNGADLAEEYFGLEVGRELYQRISEAPFEHLTVFAEFLEDNGCGTPLGSVEAQQLLFENEATLALASESLLLDHWTPVAARTDLRNVLLMSPLIVISDPVWAWGVDVLYQQDDFNWYPDWDPMSVSPAVGLVRAIRGIELIRSGISDGYIRLSRPPILPGISYSDRLFSNPTTRFTLRRVFPRPKRDNRGIAQIEESAEAKWGEGASSMTLWTKVASAMFPESLHADYELQRAVALDDFAAVNRLTTIAPEELSPFFDAALSTDVWDEWWNQPRSAARRGPKPYDEPLFNWPVDSPTPLPPDDAKGRAAPVLSPPPLPMPRLPEMTVSVADVLTIRRDEEIYELLRNALTGVLSDVGTSKPGEGADDYAERVRRAGAERFSELEERIESMDTWSKAIAWGAPKALSMLIGVGTKALGLELPGVGSVAGAGARRLVRSASDRAEATGSALKFTTNLRLLGRA